MREDTSNLEKKFLQIYYKLNLGDLLDKNPTHCLINNYPQKKLSKSCWEATDTELFILMEEAEEDQEFEIEYICRNLIIESVCLSTKNKSLKFLNILYLLHVIFFFSIFFLANSIWEGNSIAEFISVVVSFGFYIQFILIFYNWNKNKKEQIRVYIDEIKSLFLFSGYRGFYATLSVKSIFPTIVITFEVAFQFLLIFSVVF